MSLAEQIRVVGETDILISMHGAALTHVLFMKPDSYLIELFPFRFKKNVFRNLAWAKGNQDPSRTKFNLDHLIRNRLTDVPIDEVRKLPINWHNMDSKNYWRNQDTKISVDQVGEIVKQALRDKIEGGKEKFLMFAPWEQFNNQVIGFKSACALASFLKRTLVLPHIGFRYIWPEDGDLKFKVSHFRWRKFERYFDLSSMLNLPCTVITFDNFVGLNGNRSIGTLRYHHLGNETSEDQVKDYYNLVAGRKFDKLEWDLGVYYQLNKRQLIKLHSSDRSRVLALGNAFWYYNFENSQQHPLVDFHNYMDNSLYRQISLGLDFSEKIKLVMKKALASSSLLTSGYIAIHVRRGDYHTKCIEFRRVAKKEDDMSCYQSVSQIRSFLSNLYPDSKSRVLVILTNEKNIDGFNKLRSSWKNVYFQNNLLTPDVLNELYEQLDPIELAMVDQLFGIHASDFVGNLHSSFSRHIVEARILMNKTWSVFK
ncbi:hypothetical protein HDU97_002590 [Phlyctochytrium planicorne]|nr:hypothetical protein HDU97_002590 [Phlyctochytrium planicorne]